MRLLLRPFGFYFQFPRRPFDQVYFAAQRPILSFGEKTILPPDYLLKTNPGKGNQAMRSIQNFRQGANRPMEAEKNLLTPKDAIVSFAPMMNRASANQVVRAGVVAG